MVTVETTASTASGAEEKDGEFLSEGILFSALLEGLLVQKSLPFYLGYCVPKCPFRFCFYLMWVLTLQGLLDICAVGL